LSARSLRSGNSKLIGVLTQELHSPYFSGGTLGIEFALNGTGYTPVVVSAHWDAKQGMDRARMLLGRKVDALIILGGTLSDAQIIELSQECPVAITDRHIAADNIWSFEFDQVEGGRMATEHLISLGHRQIAHISGTKSQRDAADRLQGYLQAHRDADLSIDPRLIVEGDFLEDSGIHAMEKLLSSGVEFSAVFCANDQMLLGAKLALYRRGIRVPDEISMVGFDDIPVASISTPPITTVRQPTQEMGKAAALTILRALGNDVELLPHGSLALIVRETTRQV
jgi:LacI family transcriptional regulator